MRLPHMADRMANRPLVVLRLLEWVLWKYAQKASDFRMFGPRKFPTDVA